MIYLETNSDGEKSLGCINSGRIEGIGAIAQYQLLLYGICKKFNLKFYNSGFKNVGHSSYTNYDIEEWSNSFTRFFNFFTNKVIENRVSFLKIDEEFLSFIEENKDSPEDILIYIDSEGILEYGQSIINEIYEKKYLIDLKNNFIPDKKYFDSKSLNVCFHIRNINSEDISFYSFREYYDKEQIFKYSNLIKKLEEVCKGQSTVLHIHSQGNQEDFIELLENQKEDFKIVLHLNDHPINDIYHMSHADLLIMANSSFSWISHLLNYNVTLVRSSFWQAIYPNVIRLDEDYSFDTKRLRIK